MVLCVLKTLPKGTHTVPLNMALKILTKKQWMHVNLQILIFFAVWVVQYSSDQYIQTKYFQNDNRIIYIEIESVMFWLYIGTPCCIFAVMTNALESLVDASFHEIKDVHDDVNDVIKIYNQLCKHVFSTASAFRYWFVVHWFTFGAVFAIDTAIGFNLFFTQKRHYIFWIYGIATYFYSFYTFLYPCVCAARLTSKCCELLERLGILEQDDWPESHPFHNRRNVNDFLIFANQVQCGFKIGRLTFGSVLAWLSLTAQLIALIVKLL